MVLHGVVDVDGGGPGAGRLRGLAHHRGDEPTAVRATLDGLLGRPVPLDWSDEHYARAATGRTPLTDAERLALGADADRFPLFS